jgi:EAL domain-containing protein (putative c-di-GMP-specific phosphodiesterase class I)
VPQTVIAGGASLSLKPMQPAPAPLEAERDEEAPVVSLRGTPTGGSTSTLTMCRAALDASFTRALTSLWIAFQPIVRSLDQSVFGYEALLRSHDPFFEHPRALLEVAERLGQLHKLGRTVRERIVEAALHAGDEHVLFVNVHPADLMDPALSDPAAPLSRIAHRVVLEVTERASLDDVSDIHAKMRALRDIGFRIAVDDLGSGYAGLASLAQLEPDIVKLDMSLVRDIDQSSIKRKLVRSMATLCQDMSLLTVAEGVETRAECETLIELGCDLLQGYRFARPSPSMIPPSKR